CHFRMKDWRGGTGMCMLQAILQCRRIGMRRFFCLLMVLAGLLPFGTHAASTSTKLVPENNATIVSLNDRAIAVYKKGDYDQSLHLLDEIIQRFPESGLAYANRGAVYFQIGKFDEAIKDYTEAIGLGRNEAVVVLNRSTAYFKQ